MKHIPSSELIINDDGSIYHLHLKPSQLADRIILVGDPARVDTVASRLERCECEVANREYRTVTGYYGSKRVTVVSHGIGCGNLDIVMNELDALANIDFDKRAVKRAFSPLTLVRIGTSGSLQDGMPTGSYIASERSIGFDGVLYFYAGNETVRDIDMEDALVQHIAPPGIRPYIVAADHSLLEQIARDDIRRGLTITASGFYAPQGRELRLPLASPQMNERIRTFEYCGRRITNYEMESSALTGLAALMHHRALTVCCIIAGRTEQTVNTHYHERIAQLIDMVLDRI